MALLLPATHRWCVSGTPIQRGIHDLYGLILFAQRTPFTQSLTWKRCVRVSRDLVLLTDAPLWISISAALKRCRSIEMLINHPSQVVREAGEVKIAALVCCRCRIFQSGSFARSAVRPSALWLY